MLFSILTPLLLNTCFVVCLNCSRKRCLWTQEYGGPGRTWGQRLPHWASLSHRWGDRAFRGSLSQGHMVCVCTCVQACKWVYEQLKLQSAPLSPVLCTWLGCPLTDSSNNPIVRTATIPVLQKGNWRTAINLLQATQQLLGRAWMPTSKFGSVIYSWILEIQYARGGSYKKYRTWQHFEKA